MSLLVDFDIPGSVIFQVLHFPVFDLFWSAIFRSYKFSALSLQSQKYGFGVDRPMLAYFHSSSLIINNFDILGPHAEMTLVTSCTRRICGYVKFCKFIFLIDWNLLHSFYTFILACLEQGRLANAR